jgi:hypothetical protein
MKYNIKMDLRVIRCEDGRRMFMTQGRVQWRILILAVLNLLVLVTQIWLVNATIPITFMRLL